MTKHELLGNTLLPRFEQGNVSDPALNGPALLVFTAVIQYLESERKLLSP